MVLRRPDINDTPGWVRNQLAEPARAGPGCCPAGAAERDRVRRGDRDRARSGLRRVGAHDPGRVARYIFTRRTLTQPHALLTHPFTVKRESLNNLEGT